MVQSFSEYDNLGKEELQIHLNEIINDLDENKHHIQNEIQKKEKYNVNILYNSLLQLMILILILLDRKPQKTNKLCSFNI